MSTNFNNSGSHGSHTRKSAISSVSFDSSVSHKSKRHKRFSGNARSHSYSNSSRHRYESDKDSYTKLLQEFYAYNDSKYLADSDSQYTILRHWQDSSENVHFRELDRIVKHNTLFAEDNPDYFSLLEVESELIDIEDLRDWIVLSSKAKATCLHILQDTAYKENILPHYDLFNCTEEVYEELQEKQRELLRNFPNILNEAYLRAKKYLLPELALYYNIEFFKTRRLQISVSVIYKYLEDNMEEILPKAFKSEKDRLKFLTTEDVIGYQILLSDERKLSNSDKSKKAKIMIQNMTKDIYSVYGAFCNKNRHFILHIGPTNSGKTYDAIQALKSAESGIYLGPLRLLAFEEFERLNKDGCLCNLKPGEEEIVVPGARHQSSTIEVLNIYNHYDVAVIDEAQLIGDKGRGGAWTQAMLGIDADEIHVCLAPEGKEIIVKLIEDLGDTYEIVEHERLVPLMPDRRAFKFPDDVEEKDALIVFSRKSVHTVAAELSKKGIKCSLIYGALPYDVRHEEVRKFTAGETKVVVATDAIGMGLNLPIRRIVFLETDKFDGYDVRELKVSEVRQIAGRAGRKGIYETGYYTATSNFKRIKELYKAAPDSVEKAVLPLPRQLIEYYPPLSNSLVWWNAAIAPDLYEKSDITGIPKLAHDLEELTDSKELIYDLITIPFDSEIEEVYELWYALSKDYIENNPIDIISYLKYILDFSTLEALELSYKQCDLLFYFLRSICRSDLRDLEIIVRSKEEISQKIIKYLENQAYSEKKCRICGKALPYNFKYGICETCYRKM